VTYTTLAVLALPLSILLDVVVLRTRLLVSRTFWLSYLIIVGFQLLVNGLLTGHHIVDYDPSTITGLRIAYAPVEDLAFGFAMTVTTLGVWSWLGGRGRRGRSSSPLSG
jgi:lycopene cyclase domain-containing protein